MVWPKKLFFNKKFPGVLKLWFLMLFPYYLVITMHISCKPSLKFINSHSQINQYGGKKHINTLLDYKSLKIEMKERETKTKISKYK